MEELSDVVSENDILLNSINEGNILHIFEIIITYAKNQKLMLYGGTAVSYLMSKDKYPDLPSTDAYPDYDFYSTDPIYHICSIANEIHKIYPEANVSCVEAEHPGTYKLFCFYGKELLDMTYIPKHHYNILLKKSTLIKGIVVCPPRFLIIDYYKRLTNPLFWNKMEKVYYRYQYLLQNITLSTKGGSREKMFIDKSSKDTDTLSILLSSYDKDILIHCGDNVYNHYVSVLDGKKHKTNSIVYEAYCKNPYKVISDFQKDIPDSQIEIYHKYFHFWEQKCVLKVKGVGKIILYKISKSSNIPFKEVDGVLLCSYMYLLMHLFIKCMYFDMNHLKNDSQRIDQMILTLIQLRKEYNLKNKIQHSINKKHPARDFQMISETYGDRNTPKLYKAQLIEEKKLKKVPYVWRYEPKTGLKEPVPNNGYENISGNQISNVNL